MKGRFLAALFAVVLSLCLLGAMLTAAGEQAYANGVPESILPASIQHDEALLTQAGQIAKDEPSVPSVPSQIFSGHVTEAQLLSAVNQFTTPILPFAELDSHLNVTFNQILTAATSSAPLSEGQTALSASFCFVGLCGYQLGGAIIVIAGIAVACAALTAATLGAGIVCFAVLITVVTAAFIVAYYLSQLNQPERDLFALAEAQIENFGNATTSVAQGAYNWIVDTANSPYTYIAEAEAAALAQLGGNWNPALDALNSTVAPAFAGYELSTFSAIQMDTQGLYNTFAGYSGNPGCSLLVGTGVTNPEDAEFANPYGSGEEGQLCASPVAHSGEVVPSLPLLPIQAWGVGTCSGTPSVSTSQDVFYIGEGITSNSPSASLVGPFNLTYALWGSGTVSVYALNGTLLGTTISAATNGAWANWTFGAGGFMLCSSDGATIGLEASFPLTAATEEANEDDGQQTNPETLGFFGANPAFEGNSVTQFSNAEIVGYADAGICNFSIYGSSDEEGTAFLYGTCDPSSAGVADVIPNLTYLLYEIQNLALVYGEAYWAFLTYLGFSNANQLPTDCLIPTPAQLVPPDLGLNALVDMSVFQLLVVYTSELAALNATFNNSATAPAGADFTVCGLTAPVIVCGNSPFAGALNQTLVQYLTNASIIPTDPSWYACSFGLSTEGIGYVYNGVGTMGNTLADARTWLSAIAPTSYSAGIVTISGALAGVGPIPINQTWNLPLISANPTTVTVQDFSNSSNPVYADPEACLLTAGENYTDGGCVVVSPVIPYLSPASGNSTLRSGSALGTDEQSFAGAAVYLVGCIDVTGGTIFNVSSTTQTSGSCEFTSVNWTWGQTYCEQHPDASICKVGCEPTQANNECCEVDCAGYNFCLSFPIVSTFTSLLGNWLSGIGIGGVNLGGVGQAIGCIIGVIVLAVAVVGAIYAVFWVVRRA